MKTPKLCFKHEQNQNSTALYVNTTTVISHYTSIPPLSMQLLSLDAFAIFHFRILSQSSLLPLFMHKHLVVQGLKIRLNIMDCLENLIKFGGAKWPKPSLLLWIRFPSQTTLLITESGHNGYLFLRIRFLFLPALRIIQITITSSPLLLQNFLPASPAFSLCSRVKPP